MPTGSGFAAASKKRLPVLEILFGILVFLVVASAVVFYLRTNLVATPAGSEKIDSPLAVEDLAKRDLVGRERDLALQLLQTPEHDAEARFRILADLVGLDIAGPNREVYQRLFDGYAEILREQRERLVPKLVVEDWNSNRDGNFMVTEGRVTNITGDRLENITAYVNFYTEDGAFITSDSALVDYNPLMPGQTSPFKIYTTRNPLMKRAKVEFGFLLGERITTTTVDQ